MHTMCAVLMQRVGSMSLKSNGIAPQEHIPPACDTECSMQVQAE